MIDNGAEQESENDWRAAADIPERRLSLQCSFQTFKRISKTQVAVNAIYGQFSTFIQMKQQELTVCMDTRIQYQHKTLNPVTKINPMIVNFFDLNRVNINSYFRMNAKSVYRDSIAS